MSALRESWVFGIPTPKLLLEVGSFIVRTESELILKSRFVKPKRLLDSGYQFVIADIEEALDNLK